MTNEKNILRRYFSGKYSRKDFQNVRDQFLKPENRPGLRDELESEWLEFDLNEEQNKENIDYLLHRLQHRVYLEENERIKKMKPFHLMQKIAAVLFIPLFLGFAAYFIYTHANSGQVAYAEILCPNGTRTGFTLPDGTTGFLNNGSKLQYTVPFKNRQVTLVGEAFFEVQKNGEPFHVFTKNLDVEVMGTAFNVIAYENDQTEEVILQTGKVNVSSKKGGNSSELDPNQQLVFNLKNQEFTVRQVDAALFTSWCEGKLVFRNEGLADVAKRIGRWYDIDIEIADEQLENYTFHATFMNQNLTEVLDLLSYTSPISYQVEKGKATNSATFLTRKKVILKMDKTKEHLFQ